VRIGIDMLAVQSPWSRGRGIGRLGRNLVASFLARDTVNEYVLYAHRDLPTDHIPGSSRARRALITAERPADRSAQDAVDRLVAANPDGLDVFLVLSPLDDWCGYGPPAKPLNALKLAACVYDAIPFLFQEKYLAHEPTAVGAYRRLERLRHYDHLLAISGSTRTDFQHLLGLPAHRIVTVHCDTTEGFFHPAEPGADPEPARRALHQLGIDGPFVFTLGGADEQNDRKNMFGVMEAFHLLPEQVRSAHQLVITCALPDRLIERVRAFAASRGIEARLVLTNEIPDAAVRVLYQRCAAFVFPSFYEGFGLPLLEAMRCGAPVVAGDNSSQREVVGAAGLLANPDDRVDIAAKLTRILTDAPLAQELRRRAREQAGLFTWEKTTQRVLDAIVPAASPGPAVSRLPRRGAPKPRIAVFSPFAPKISGISDYIASLIGELRHTYTIDLFHDAGYVPDLGLASAEFGCFDHRLFARRDKVLNYRAVLYQMGNSQYHRFVFEALERHPGIVTLHDFFLPHFQWWCPVPDVPDDYLQRRVMDLGQRVIVHSSWCRDQVAALFPQHLEKTVVIPLGARAEVVPVDLQHRAREQFGLPASALLFGAVGHMTAGKMNLELVEAFAGLAEFPDALLVFIGQDHDGGASRRRAEALGIAARVRVLGRQPSPLYEELIATVDVGVCLRSPPTSGETSAALLDLMRLGVPTVVNSVGTFSAYPDSVVRRVRLPEEGIPALTRTLRELAADSRMRKALGRAAWVHVDREHAWPRAAARYVEVIEGCPKPALGGAA
jgi:glycosyltransferase involved in cell wall biosynthesis